MREKITTFLLGALGCVCVLAFAAVYYFGIYRTFDRYGSVYGFAALAVPPYAAYRCAAVFWEQPKWKADYAGAAETIATVILSDKSKDGANAAGLVKVERTLREFLAQLPAQEIDKLGNLRALCSTCNQGAKNVTTERPSTIYLLAQIRRAGSAEQQAVLNFLKKKLGS